MRDRVVQGLAPPEPCPGRHCWVSGGAGEDAGAKSPGLLVEWRQVDSGWEGRVVYLARWGPGRWVLAEEWLAAPLLAPL
jgi:hypothetical protein